MKSSLVIILIAIIVGIGAGTFYLHNKQQASIVVPNSIGQTTASVKPSAEIMGAADSRPDSVGTPKRLIITKIGVNAPVELVGLDKQGRMDVPKDANDAGWYDLGVKPGQKGNAVMDGHLDKVNGAPAIFWNLKKLAPGDQ